MCDFLVLSLHLVLTLMRLAKPGGFRSVVAESVLIRHQLLILNRGRKRAPNLHGRDRLIAGLCTLFIRRARILRSAIVLKPSTLLSLHRLLTKRKYRLLFSPRCPRRPGPKGPGRELIHAVVEMKRRNPDWGCPRIAQQISLAFGVAVDKDVVRRILGIHYRPQPSSAGPSWLTFLGHAKDSLWSCELFRCESATLRTHWVLVVMDQFSRRIVGFAAWLTAPRCAACSNERSEFLDRTLFWTTSDLETKLTDFQHYYNAHRTHAGLARRLPGQNAVGSVPIDRCSYRWLSHCRGLYQTPVAA